MKENNTSLFYSHGNTHYEGLLSLHKMVNNPPPFLLLLLASFVDPSIIIKDQDLSPLHPHPLSRVSH